MEKTVEIDGVKFTVHQETGKHAALKRQLHAKVYASTLGADDPEWALWVEFANIYIRSTDVVVPGLDWPPLTLNPEILLPVRDAWFALSGKVYWTWVNALDSTDPDSDPDMLPANETDPKGKPRKPKTSAPSSE